MVSLGIFISKGDPRLAPKGSNYEVLAGKILRSLQFLRRSELAPKVISFGVPAGDFHANGV